MEKTRVGQQFFIELSFSEGFGHILNKDNVLIHVGGEVRTLIIQVWVIYDH